jgi:hypothetical protein
MYYRKFCRRRNFLNSSQKKKKKNMIAILDRNSEQIMKSNRDFTDKRHLCPAFVVTTTSTFIPFGVFILRTSVTKNANKHTNLYL